MKTADADVGKYLEMFTFLEKEQVAEIMIEHQVIISINCKKKYTKKYKLSFFN